MNTVVVIPTYNEAGNIEPLIKQILGLHPDLSIIVVDDNSPDGTGQIADAISAKDSRVSCRSQTSQKQVLALPM